MFLLFFIVCSHCMTVYGQGSCVFSSEPVTMTVMVGETAEFGCICEGSNSVPSWIIQRSIYPALELPYPYEYISETSSLIVHDVTLSLNQTTIQCMVIRQRSSEGILFVVEKEATTTTSSMFISYNAVRYTSSHFLPTSTTVREEYLAAHSTIRGTSSFTDILLQQASSVSMIEGNTVLNSTSILTSCLKCDQSQESSKSTMIIILALAGIILIIVGASATILFFIIRCGRFHHLKKKQNSDPHIYEEPNPNANEPIYELVGPDGKDITLETNEAYIDHVMTDPNAAYEVRRPSQHDNVHCETNEAYSHHMMMDPNGAYEMIRASPQHSVHSETTS